MVENVFSAEEQSELVDRNLSNFIPLLNLQRGDQQTSGQTGGSTQQTQGGDSQ